LPAIFWAEANILLCGCFIFIDYYESFG